MGNMRVSNKEKSIEDFSEVEEGNEESRSHPVLILSLNLLFSIYSVNGLM